MTLMHASSTCDKRIKIRDFDAVPMLAAIIRRRQTKRTSARSSRLKRRQKWLSYQRQRQSK